MKDKKYYVALDDFERRVVVNCMNEMRNSLIENGKCTEALDEVLLKVISICVVWADLLLLRKSSKLVRTAKSYFAPVMRNTQFRHSSFMPPDI